MRILARQVSHERKSATFPSSNLAQHPDGRRVKVEAAV
jgi:hypothetical protein